MPQPKIGDDVTHLMPAAGEDVTAMMGDSGDSSSSWTDTALDLLPLAGGIVGGIVGAPTGPGAIGTAALGGAAGQGVKGLLQGLLGKRNLAQDTPLSVAQEMGEEGVKQGVGQAVGMGTTAGLRMLGKGLARASFGAQKGLRAKFPTVDVDAVALREGVGPGNIRKAAALSKAANQNVDDVAAALDASGAKRVQPREMVKNLRKPYDRAKTAKFADDQAEIVGEAKRLRRAHRGGESLKDSNVVRQEHYARSDGYLQGAADPRKAGTASKIHGEVGKAISEAQRSRGGNMGEALDRSQQMMALEKIVRSSEAHTPMLRFLLPVAGAGTGYAAGGDTSDVLKGAALGLAATNPTVLFKSGQLSNAIARPTGEMARVLAMLAALSEEK